MIENAILSLHFEELEDKEVWADIFEKVGASPSDNWTIELKSGTILRGNGFRIATDNSSGLTIDNNKHISFTKNDIEKIHWLG